MPRSAFFLSSNNTAFNKSGAEFILPWMIDIAFQHVHEFKKLFSKVELDLLVQAHRETFLEDSWTEKEKLISRIEAYFSIKEAGSISASAKTSLLLKLRRLEDSEAASLSVWAYSFWQLLTEQPSMDINAYIA